MLESHRTDPRSGEVNYRLQNITRAEPPAELFEVPADYTIIEAPDRGPGPRRP